jgi:hypothetical protein
MLTSMNSVRSIAMNESAFQKPCSTPGSTACRNCRSSCGPRGIRADLVSRVARPFLVLAPATIRVLQGATLNLSTLHRTLAACLFWLKCTVLTRRRPLPVFPDKLTFLASVGISQTCTKLTRCEALEKNALSEPKRPQLGSLEVQLQFSKSLSLGVFAASPIGDHRVLFAHRRGGLV